LEPVTVKKFLSGMLVRPASMLKVDEPATPDKNSEVVLTSCEKDWPPLKIRKFEFTGNNPFLVKEIAKTAPVPEVFWIKIDFETNGKLYPLT
jgi:hypothetical protein